MKKENKDKLFLWIVVFILLVAAAIFWHPWINQETVESAFEEYWGCSACGGFTVSLTGWQPFGQEFHIYQGSFLHGKGLVNIWGVVVSYEPIWG